MGLQVTSWLKSKFEFVFVCKFPSCFIIKEIVHGGSLWSEQLERLSGPTFAWRPPIYIKCITLNPGTLVNNVCIVWMKEVLSVDFKLVYMYIHCYCIKTPPHCEAFPQCGSPEWNTRGNLSEQKRKEQAGLVSDNYLDPSFRENGY